MKTLRLFFLFVLFPVTAFTQSLSVGADLRPRFEYRHGYGSLFPEAAAPAAFVTQRSRLNLGYTADKLQLWISLQDVSTWGDTRQLAPADSNNSFSLFQAWARLKLNENLALKLGRQVISYDDERILGEVDWAMQGRFHDALLLKFKKKDFLMDLGVAFSQENQNLTGTGYTINGFFTYKTMQYAYFKKKWDNINISYLFLNNGFQKFSDSDNNEPDGIYNRQTTGAYFEFPVGKINFSGSAYYQFGKATPDVNLKAYQLAFQGNYKTGNSSIGLGFEILSGTDQDTELENNSFFPLYGTNHKFNGFMDYFYVGNHANNVGLNDIFGKLNLKTGEKSSLLLAGHYFSSHATLRENADKYLGTEIDLVYGNQLFKNVKLNVGYSHMFASSSIGLIKNENEANNINNWAWIQLKINPELLQFQFGD